MAFFFYRVFLKGKFLYKNSLQKEGGKGGIITVKLLKIPLIQMF